MRDLSFIYLIFVVSCSMLLSGCMSSKKAEEKESYEVSQVQRGRQLVAVAGCNDCHTPKIQTPEDMVLDPKRLLSGHPEEAGIPDIPRGVIDSQDWNGVIYTEELTVWAGPWGVSFAANLTPHPTTGIGNWTADDFIKAMRTGRHIGVGRKLLPPMPWEEFSQFSDEDLTAIFAYLRTLTPIENKVPAPIPPNDVIFE